MMTTLKSLFLNHVEKIVFLGVLIWGGIYLYINIFSASDYNQKSNQLEKMMDNIRRKRESSQPDPLTAEDFHSKLLAPFTRVPPVKIQDVWRVHVAPTIEVSYTMVVGAEMNIPLRIVHDIQPTVNFLEGKETIQVDPSGTPGNMKVKGIAGGTAKLEYVGANGYKETHSYFLKNADGGGPKRGETPNPPTKVLATVERGRVLITWEPPATLPIKSKIVAYQVYRREADGPFEKIHLVDAGEISKNKASSAFSTAQPAPAPTPGTSPAAGAVTPAPGTPSLPGGTPPEGNLPGGNLPGGGMPNPGNMPNATPPAGATPGQPEAGGASSSTPGTPAAPAGSAEGPPKLPGGALTMSKDGPAASAKKEKEDSTQYEFIDSKFKPDTVYVYGVVTIAKDSVAKNDERLESKMEKSKEVLTTSNLEIFFTGTANEFAMITIKKWFNEKDFIDEKFFVLVGDIVGGDKFVKIPGEDARKKVDFSTGDTLVDIVFDVRKVQIVPVEKNVFNPDGSFKKRPEDDKPMKEVVNVEIVKDTAKIIVVDLKGRTREYYKDDQKGGAEKSASGSEKELMGTKPTEETPSTTSDSGGETKQKSPKPGRKGDSNTLKKKKPPG